MTTTSELRSTIETKGEEITEIAHRIEDRIEQYVDWKGVVNERPLVSVAAAFGVGLLLAGAAVPLLKFAGRQSVVVAKGAASAAAMGYINDLISKQRTAKDSSKTYGDTATAI